MISIAIGSGLSYIVTSKLKPYGYTCNLLYRDINIYYYEYTLKIPLTNIEIWGNFYYDINKNKVKSDYIHREKGDVNITIKEIEDQINKILAS